MTRKRAFNDPVKDQQILRALRKELIANTGRIKPRRMTAARTEMQRRLDEVLLGFRAARRAAAVAGMMGENRGWLRAVRQAVGVPVEVLARRLGVTRDDIFRMEKAEWGGRILLDTLTRAATAMGCEVVYALAPREGSLADLAAAERAEQERVREEIRALEAERVKKIERRIGWKKAIRRSIRKEFRKQGIRVR